MRVCNLVETRLQRGLSDSSVARFQSLADPIWVNPY